MTDVQREDERRDRPAAPEDRDEREEGSALEDGAVRAEVGRDGAAEAEALLPGEAADRYRKDWEEIQRGFVDEPRSSVERADRLVEDLMQRLSASFSNERSRLEEQWDSGDDVSTEDLRVALTRYRSFFERLLAA